jgi:hypothetical protein
MREFPILSASNQRANAMPIGEDIQRPEKKGSRGWNWLLWWRIDPVDLDEQVRLYDTMGFRGSMRGISVMLLVLSAVITAIMAYFGAANFNASAFVDVAVFLFLAIFIYLGHRWAMIGAMILWTLEKVLSIVGTPTSAVVAVIWWALYMHAFYFAFRIEQKRRTLAREADATLRTFE